MNLSLQAPKHKRSVALREPKLNCELLQNGYAIMSIAHIAFRFDPHAVVAGVLTRYHWNSAWTQLFLFLFLFQFFFYVCVYFYRGFLHNWPRLVLGNQFGVFPCLWHTLESPELEPSPKLVRIDIRVCLFNT